VAEQKQLAPRPRLWVVEADPETGELDPEQITEAIVEAATIVNRVGGVVLIASRREELPPDTWGVPVEGVYGTTALVVKWESYAPVPRPQPAPEPEEAPEPVAVAG
jgi:hypothetical protein